MRRSSRKQQEPGRFNDGRPHDYALGLVDRHLSRYARSVAQRRHGGYRAWLSSYPERQLVRRGAVQRQHAATRRSMRTPSPTAYLGVPSPGTTSIHEFLGPHRAERGAWLASIVAPAPASHFRWSARATSCGSNPVQTDRQLGHALHVAKRLVDTSSRPTLSA